MDHLQDTHESIDYVAVRRLIDDDIYMLEIPGYERGNCSFSKFHTFPTLHGWKIHPDYRLLSDGNPVHVPGESLHGKLAPFLQTWLFFGLIYTIVRDDDGPLLRFEELCNISGRNIATHNLNEALGRWRDWVQNLSKNDYSRAQLYMVQVEFCLNEARMVVRKTCGYTSLTDRDPSVVEEGRVSDELALALMVLGETLSSWKGRILHNNGTAIRGWHKEEDDNGWGPSRKVFRLMQDRWCPWTLHLLQSQLRSSATLMLSAHQFIRDIAAFSQGSVAHRNCTTVGCKITPGTYETTHRYTPKCNCKQLAPDMSEILKILTRKDANAIPLLAIRNTKIIHFR